VQLHAAMLLTQTPPCEHTLLLHQLFWQSVPE